MCRSAAWMTLIPGDGGTFDRPVPARPRPGGAAAVMDRRRGNWGPELPGGRSRSPGLSADEMFLRIAAVKSPGVRGAAQTPWPKVRQSRRKPSRRGDSIASGREIVESPPAYVPKPGNICGPSGVAEKSHVPSDTSPRRETRVLKAEDPRKRQFGMKAWSRRGGEDDEAARKRAWLRPAAGTGRDGRGQRVSAASEERVRASRRAAPREARASSAGCEARSREVIGASRRWLPSDRDRRGEAAIDIALAGGARGRRVGCRRQDPSTRGPGRERGPATTRCRGVIRGECRRRRRARGDDMF